MIGKWNKEDDISYYILITNQLNISAKKVITKYLLRWGIELCFKKLKDTYYFNHHQARHIDKIEGHWNLCLIAWTLTHWIKQMPILIKSLKRNPQP